MIERFGKIIDELIKRLMIEYDDNKCNKQVNKYFIIMICEHLKPLLDNQHLLIVVSDYNERNLWYCKTCRKSIDPVNYIDWDDIKTFINDKTLDDIS